MALIRDEDKKYLIEEFEKNLKEEIDLVVFTSNDSDCKYCKETVELATEVSELSDRINIESYVFEDSCDVAKEF